MSKCDFNNVALQLYWNRISAWVFSCKFAAYFQNTFFQEHLWVAASEIGRYQENEGHWIDRDQFRKYLFDLKKPRKYGLQWINEEAREIFVDSVKVFIDV